MLREAIREGVFAYGEGVTGRHYDLAKNAMDESIKRFSSETTGAADHHPGLFSMRQVGQSFLNYQRGGYIGIMSVPGHLNDGSVQAETMYHQEKYIVAVILAQEYHLPFGSDNRKIRQAAREGTYKAMKKAVKLAKRLHEMGVDTMDTQDFHQYITDIIMGRASTGY